MRPKRRTEKLISRKLDEDLLVYDLDRNKAHCLNKSATLVFDLCDGERTIAELTDTVAGQLGIADAGPVVELALDRLSRAHLLEPAPERTGLARSMSRREVMKALKSAAVLLPVVSSLLAPTALSAASGISIATCQARAVNMMSCGPTMKCENTMTFCGATSIAGMMVCRCL